MTQSNSVRIGELLIRSGVVTPENLESAVALANKMRVPLGRVLDMHGYLSEYALQCAIHIQSMIGDRELTLEQGIRALETVVKQDVDLETAIRHVQRSTQTVPQENVGSNKLGELLGAAGLVTPVQLRQALHHASNTGLPLGMVLTHTNAITEQLLNAGLTAQRMIRDGQLTRDEGLQALRAARLRSTTFEQSLIDHRFDAAAVKKSFAVPDLLVQAGLINDSQLLAARELELLEEKSLNEILLECGLTSDALLTAAAHLIGMIDEGMLADDQAIQIMRKLKHTTTGDEVAEVLSDLEILEPTDEGIDLTELLMRAAFVSDKEIQIATPLSLATRTPLIKMLMDANLIDHKIIENATICKALIDNRVLELEQGIIALVYAVENAVTMEETVRLFGWIPGQAA